MRTALRSKLGLGLLAFVALGCGRAPESAESVTKSAALVPLASCGEAEAALRSSALRAMNRRLDQALDDFLKSGGACYAEDGAKGAGGSGGSLNQPSAGNGASQVSGTNDQVVGVDEADFVKNDNQYIYVVSDGALRIIQAWPAASAHPVAKVTLEGTPKKLFVASDRALVYSSIGGPSPDPYGGSYGGSSECTYGYDCDFSGDGSKTRISVYDIADRTQPKLVRQLDLSGSYINSRRIDGSVHTVVHDARDNFQGVSYWPDGLSMCTEVSPIYARALFEQLRRKNTAIIRESPITDWLPSVVDTHFENGQARVSANLLAGCDGFYDSPLGDGSGFISLLSLSLDDPNSLSSSTIVSRPGAVYASDHALYVAVRQSADEGYGWYEGMSSHQASAIHEFELSESPARATYVASGLVEGAVLNQFSLDEWQGHLRVATTNGHVPSPDVTSTVTVLAREGGALVETGRIDGIAPHEDIRSVRFAEDKAFVGTFKQTAPLWVFDLRDPAAPRVLGELQIPGFSTYMQMMDPTHLLTIGYDANDQGNFAWFAGVMLQIFDVSDATNPALLHKEIIGTRGSSSEALTDHLAFNYFAPKNLLSFPITVCEGGDLGTYGDTMTFSGLLVYDTTVADGFTLRGKVAHPMDLATGGYDNSACSNWWTQASSKVKRSIIMDDFVYSISDELIKVDSLDSLGTDLAVIPITG